MNHPEYSAETHENDVAILRLEQPVTINNYVNWPGLRSALRNNIKPLVSFEAAQEKL